VVYRSRNRRGPLSYGFCGIIRFEFLGPIGVIASDKAPWWEASKARTRPADRATTRLAENARECLKTSQSRTFASSAAIPPLPSEGEIVSLTCEISLARSLADFGPSSDEDAMNDSQSVTCRRPSTGKFATSGPSRR
jgi:hypothetical protein